MNRETRRRLQQNQIIKQKQNVPTVDYKQALHHEQLRKVYDDGIMLGFETATYLFTKIAKNIKGIGEKRTKQIRIEFDRELERLKREV